jgi:hypothetical protein
MLLGRLSRHDRLYAAGYSINATAQLSQQLATTARCVSEGVASTVCAQQSRGGEAAPATPFTPPPEGHVTYCRFFFVDDYVIRQIEDSQPVPVISNGTQQRDNGTMTGRRRAALIRLRDLAHRVLQSQNEGWPDAHRDNAHRDLNRACDLFVSQYGPINRTTFSETVDGSVIRRMPRGCYALLSPAFARRSAMNASQCQPSKVSVSRS